MSAPVRAADLLRLAVPAGLSVLLNNAFRVIDQLAAGSIGTPAQAAIGSCTFVVIAIYGVHLLIAAGAGPLVGRATGAGDMELRRRAVGASLVGGTGVAALVALVVGLGADAIATGLGLQGETRERAGEFMRVIAVLGWPAAMAPVIDAILVAVGRTGLMMALQVTAGALNYLLNPVFIHDLELGVSGAALATCVGRAVQVAVGLWVVWRLTGWKLEFGDTLVRVTRVGQPIMWNTLAYAGVYFLLLRTTISPLGPVVNAALGIGFSALEGITWPIFMGVSLAVSSLVGRRLGAGQPDQAARAARIGLPMTLGLGLLASLAFGFAARPLCAPFTSDPAVLEAAMGYAHALAWSQVCVAVEALAEGVLLGAGDSRAVFWLSAPINIARVPLAWWLCHGLGWGPAGVWWAINLTSLLKATAKAVAVGRGGWRRVVV